MSPAVGEEGAPAWGARVSVSRAVALLFVVSFALRFLVLVWVVRGDVPLLYDEADYYHRAVGFSRVFTDLGHFRSTSAEDRARAYGDGYWPPLHPMLLGLGLALGGERPAVARFVMVLVSALTTALVYRVARQLVPSRPEAAWAAAGLHLLYPTFIAYSHSLWSETTFILLLLAAVSLAVRAARDLSRGRRLMAAALAGAFLGLGSLTRAAGLAFLPVVPLWLGRSGGPLRLRIKTGAVTLLAGLAVLVPWQRHLAVEEGRFVPLSKLGGYNLALGNNPWVPPGYGSSWGHESSKAKLRQAMQEIARRERATTWESAGFAVALKELKRDPWAFPVRSLERLRMFWAPDFFPLRHLFHATYPPLRPALAGALFVAVVAAYLALLILATLGLFSTAVEGRGLIVGLSVLGMVPAVFTVGMSRLHLPLLAVLLPAAGYGVALLFRPRGSGVRRAPLLFVVPFSAVALSALPYVVELYLIPSSYYGSVLRRFDSLLGTRTTCSDRIVLRREGGTREALVIKAEGEGLFSSGSEEVRWVAGAPPELVLDLTSPAGATPALNLESPGTGQRLRLLPVRRESWRQWQPSGVDNITYMWAGGGPSPR